MSNEAIKRIGRLLSDRMVRPQMDINQSRSSTALWGMFFSDDEFVEYIKTFDSLTVAEAFTLGFAELHGRVLKQSEYKLYIKTVRRALARLEYVRGFKKKNRRVIGGKTPARIKSAHEIWMQMRETSAKNVDWENSGLADIGLKGQKKNPVGSSQRREQVDALQKAVQAYQRRLKRGKVS
jgi:hypothetical protein